MLFLILIYLAFVSLGLPDSILGTSWPLMRVDLNVPVDYAGFISFTVAGGTIISSLLSHRLIKRFGTGTIVVTSVFMTASALLGFALSRHFIFLVFLAVPLGLGAGAIDAGLNKHVAENYEAKHMNWLHSFWGLGAIIGPIFVSFFIELNNGWRYGYLVISILQFILAFALLFSLSKWKAKENGVTTENAQDNDHKVGLKVIIAVMASYFLYMAIEAGVILWGATYLIEVKAYSESFAALTISLYFMGITLGRMGAGFLSMRLGNNTLIKIGTILILSGIALLFIPLKILGLVGILLIGFGLAPIYPALLHQTPITFGHKNAQKMMGRQMAFAYTSTTFMPPIMGFILAKIGFLYFPFFLTLFGGLLFLMTFFYSKKNNNGHA